MLVSYERFHSSPVMSLQTGSELARTSRAIINPRNLTIVAYELEGDLLTNKPSLLLISDIREIGPLGIIIDSTDELVSPDDVIKIKEIYEFNFNLVGLKVIDDRRKTIGKVNGYSIESGDFTIQQIAVKRPLWHSFGDTELLIHRSQVVKVTDDSIIVKSPTIKQTENVVQPTQVFDNPFRKTTPSQADTIDD